MMAKLEEGQTAEYWWKKAEQYRKTLGETNAAFKRLQQKLKEREEELVKLRKVLRNGQSKTCKAIRDEKTQTIVCSECGGGGLTIPNKGQRCLRNFCPNCGALIDKEDAE